MEECEICGAKTNGIYVVDVEDVELRVCTKCAKGKKIISRASDDANVAKRRIMEKKDEEAQLIDNYGVVMHNARESMKLPLKVLAEMLNEKETLLRRIEQQRTLPSVQLAKKLEKALGIKLSESEQEKDDTGAGRSGDRATLGDFVKKA